MSDQKRIGILLSGRGSNFVAIADNVSSGMIPNACVAVVISDKTDAKGIQTAQARGLPNFVIERRGRTRQDHDLEIVAKLWEHKVDLVCLAGYMRLLSPWFVQQFPNAILNIHPALLPSFPGNHAHRDTLAHGVKISGCTVHLVNEKEDDGPIVVQKAVPVLDDDDEDKLSARILKQEHIAYTEAINIILNRQFQITGRRLVKG